MVNPILFSYEQIEVIFKKKSMIHFLNVEQN